jgi:hypothetical protein
MMNENVLNVYAMHNKLYTSPPVNHFIVVVGVVVAKLLNVLIEDEFIGA